MLEKILALDFKNLSEDDLAEALIQILKETPKFD